jgi:cytochrome c oxidase cbb3-type subunit 3
MSTAWSWYVIALVILNLGGSTWLLWWTAKRRAGDPKPDDTSHYWDGDITEYNKPMPRWWILGFYISLVFGVAYFAWYGGLGSYAGYSGWTSAAEHDTAKAEADAQLEQTFARFSGKDLPVLARDPDALRLGRSIFANVCAACHGSSGQGAIGYPNLTDSIWHWGGSPDRILETVLDGREGIMPEWGTVLTGMGGPGAVDQVVAYVRTLSNPKTLQNNVLAAKGKPLYEGVCVACHGGDGKGNQMLGAPDLTDDYWLYGNSTDALRKAVSQGLHGSMPAHRALLGETRSRLAAAYVWSLSNQVED